AGDKQFAHNHAAAKVAASRADIIDRNGALLATTLAAPSLYANPKQVLDARGTAQKLVEILPDLNQSEVYQKLTSERSFVWLKRQLTPRQQFEVNRIGDPGLQFEREERRVYPDGNLVSHVVGYVGIDNRGLAGIERSFDEPLRTSSQPV